MKPLLVPGHTLAYEGAAHDDKGHVESRGGYVFRGGSGRAKCSCGELSPVMTSAAQRRQWHRDHKNDIRGSQVLAEIEEAGSFEAWRDKCDHENRCCHEHGIHVDPHRGCILR